MNLLLDTHTFIWFNEGSSQLSTKAKEDILNPENQCFVSAASLWEMSIKINKGLLTIWAPFDSIMDDVTENGFIFLPIDFQHLKINTRLPFHHKDPFDRILISQALAQDMNVIGCDVLFDPYFADTKTQRVW